MSDIDGPSHDPECELCQADRFTHWYHEDDICWVADCEACGVPMVVWNHHGTTPPDADVEHALDRLSEVARTRFGRDFTIDRLMRQVPEHFHAHARDGDWWSKRMTRPLSRYTGVGGDRATIG